MCFQNLSTKIPIKLKDSVLIKKSTTRTIQFWQRAQTSPTKKNHKERGIGTGIR